MRLVAALVCGLLLAHPAVAQDDPYLGLFVSDPAVCALAAETDLSNALFEHNATALIPYEELLASELRCEFNRVEPEPAAGGFELFAWAQCQQIEGSYGDFLWMKALPDGSVSVSSRHFDELVGTQTLRTFVRCTDLDPDTVKR